MCLEELPDLVLHEICLKLQARDITSLQKTHPRIRHHIKAHRIHYEKYRVSTLILELSGDGRRKVRVIWPSPNSMRTMRNIGASVDDVVYSTNPDIVKSYDHDELLNMNQLWWNERKEIELYDIIDYRRYLPHFDRCTSILLKSSNPMNLSEILAPMNTQHLKMLSLEGNGKLECTDDDLRKIGRLSKNMKILNLANISESSIVSNDAIVDMIEIGSFARDGIIALSRFQENIMQCLSRRDCVIRHRLRAETTIEIKKFDGVNLWIHKAEKRDIFQIRLALSKIRNTTRFFVGANFFDCGELF